MLSANHRLPTHGARALLEELRPGSADAHTRRNLMPVLAIAGAAAIAALLITHGHEFLSAIERALGAGWVPFAVGAVLEVASLAGYTTLLHHVVGRGSAPLRPRDSYDIALGGAAATRLLPTAGLGGVAVAVWALRARGLRPRELTERMLAFLLILYGVYALATFVAGAAVGLGLVHVSRGQTLGLVGMALSTAVVTTVVLVFTRPAPVHALLGRIATGEGRAASTAARAAEQLPVLRTALRRAARELLRPSPALLGALASWGFDLGVLVAMLHAFGVALPLGAIVLAYFLGTLFNLIPLPGMLSGGLAGALIALGAPAAPAIAAVLAYRAIAVWLPAASGIASLASLRASIAGWRAQSAERADSAAGADIRTPGRQFAV